MATEQQTMEVSQYQRPVFLDALNQAYSLRGKSVVLLTGDTHDLFYSEGIKGYQSLDQTIYTAMKDRFTVIRVDSSYGVSFFHKDDRATVASICARSDATNKTLYPNDESILIGDFTKVLSLNRNSPLTTLISLRQILDAAHWLRKLDERSEKQQQTRPVCVIVKFAGSILPSGEFSGLSEVDRQKLVTFMNMVEDPDFRPSRHLIILVADTSTEVNSRVTSLPTCQTIEIGLPNRTERAQFVETMQGRSQPPAQFERSAEDFIDDTAGLSLTALKNILEGSSLSQTSISRKDVVAYINQVLSADLGGIISISMPEHRPPDIVGYEETGKILRDIFKACENPETAVSAILVSGPNGAGKTFQLEAYAAESGRVVIELKGLRGMYFGQTDAFFEKLRLRLVTYGKILILMDEAHTQFGSVHKADTHETEKRLAGNIIKMMGDPALLGKVLWAMMSSRPDELDPDIKSRAPEKIAIFDLEGDQRTAFVTEMFRRKGVEIASPDLPQVMEETSNYSARDFNFLVRKAKGFGCSVPETLARWQADTSIMEQRRFQMLVAAKHCSYKALLPEELRNMAARERDDEIQRLMAELRL